MTISAIQTPILIIGAFLVLFLGLHALGSGSIVDGWNAMLAHAQSLNKGVDGTSHGINHLMHFEESDPLYGRFPGFGVFIGAAIIGFWYWCTDQHIVQRVLGQTKGEDNRKVMTPALTFFVRLGVFHVPHSWYGCCCFVCTSRLCCVDE